MTSPVQTATIDPALQGDLDWLELDVYSSGDAATLTLAQKHVTPYGRLYGGMGSSVMSAMIEAVTGRPLLWCTTQFVGPSFEGDRLTIRAQVGARGSRASQVTVIAEREGIPVLIAVGAAGRPDPAAPAGTILAAPDVPSPLECERLHLDVGTRSRGFFGLVEQRRIDDPRYPNASRRWWMRLDDRSLTRSSLLGLAGDCVAPMVTRAVGELGAGTSLDNTIRVGAPSDSEWILVDGDPEFAMGGFGHGTVRLWDHRGILVGIASQTASLWRTHPMQDAVAAKAGN